MWKMSPYLEQQYCEEGCTCPTKHDEPSSNLEHKQAKGLGYHILAADNHVNWKGYALVNG